MRLQSREEEFVLSKTFVIELVKNFQPNHAASSTLGDREVRSASARCGAESLRSPQGLGLFELASIYDVAAGVKL
jgi:hypothetical protein